MCCIDKIVEEIYIGKGYCYDQTFYNRGGKIRLEGNRVMLSSQ